MSENNVQQVIGSAKSVVLNQVFRIFATYKILNTQIVKSFLGTGGTVTPNPDQVSIDVKNTTSVGSFALLRSTRVLKYRPGYVNVVRFGATFSPGVANSIQFIGVQNEGNQLTFAFDGVDFVTRVARGGRLEIRTLTVTAAETGAATGTVTLDGVVFNPPLTNAGGDISFTAHEIADFTYTGWSTEHIGNQVIFQSAAIVAPLPGTYSYSSSGASTGTFVQSQAGVIATNNDVLQVDWNGNSEMITQLNPLLFNTYEIEYTWLGGGNINFRVLNGRDGKYETVHQYVFANISSIPSIEQPNMFAGAATISLGSTTALTLTTTGIFGGTYGNTRVVTPIYGVDNERTISANTETVVIAVKNRRTVNDVVNQSEVFIERISGAVDGNRAVKIKVVKNPTTLGANTTGDYDDFQYVNETESLSLFDTTALTFTGGEILDEFFVGKDGNLAIDYYLRELELFQNDIIIFTAFSTATNVVNLSVTLLEDP